MDLRGGKHVAGAAADPLRAPEPIHTFDQYRIPSALCHTKKKCAEWKLCKVEGLKKGMVPNAKGSPKPKQGEEEEEKRLFCVEGGIFKVASAIHVGQHRAPDGRNDLLGKQKLKAEQSTDNT